MEMRETFVVIGGAPNRVSCRRPASARILQRDQLYDSFASGTHNLVELLRYPRLDFGWMRQLPNRFLDACSQ